MRALWVCGCFSTVLAFCLTSCNPLTEKSKTKAPSDEDLRLTLGGFRENHPDEGEIGGTCTPDSARLILECDVHNGLVGWTVTDLTFVVTWSPYKDSDKGYYEKKIFLEPFQAKRVSLILGHQLPRDTRLKLRTYVGPLESHWGWSIVGAQGHPVAKSP
jgi:hypothetical protein